MRFSRFIRGFLRTGKIVQNCGGGQIISRTNKEEEEEL